MSTVCTPLLPLLSLLARSIFFMVTPSPDTWPRLTPPDSSLQHPSIHLLRTRAQVSTDIIHFLSKKLHYYKGDYDTFVNVRTELAKNQRRAYEASAAKKAHMQEFIDKFRSNAKRASLVQSRIKVRFAVSEKLGWLYSLVRCAHTT